ncbi:hypothetical protein L915_09965 [Phytophthora nicotianae]|uniref:PiggyBac transposable element-derived protein domain-containing protein n=1 Tax=Phytophthora nicotianae TaxID=4792 RepID=W2GSA6_PHYNI|nr:hypothetical protein L915_09965 [Phytophthora nicotianae]
MNGVDRVDQLRSTNPIRRKETRLSMNTLTWAMDMALINAFCIFNKVSGSACKRVTLREFKRRVAEQLTLPQRVRMERKRRPTPPAETLQEIVGMDTSVHTITPNSTKFSKGKLVCYLCTLRGLSKKASVREALDAVCAAASGDAVVQPRLKNNKTITTLDQLELIAD